MKTENPSLFNVQNRGKLKIFLGMCAGVGKTYTMLSEAKQRLADGVDVVVGYVETHSRRDTEAMLVGLPQIERKKMEHRGVEIEEMNLNHILRRRPQLVVVDELPHTNVVGCRHNKRYQDILEILDAGIDVYTALNVQHIESRVDVVQSITSVYVRETVPDSILDIADDIKLIDISPDDLRSRLADGKVYLGQRAANAADHFFKIENLSALREIALRLMSEKVGQDVREAMLEKHIRGPWKSSERFMVAVGPSPSAERLIRWTRRVASATHSSWIAVHIDNFKPLSPEDEQRLSQNLSLVKQLGGETISLSSVDISKSLLSLALEKNITQIIVGKPQKLALEHFLGIKSIVDKLILNSGDIDICVVRGSDQIPKKKKRVFNTKISPTFMSELGKGLSFIGVLTLLFWFIKDYANYSSFALIYLLAIVIFATLWSRGVILALASITALLWNFLFIPPIFTFYIGKLNDFLMFCMYFIIALVVGHLTSQIKQRERSESLRVKRTAVLYKLAQCVVESRTLDEGIRLAISQIDQIFDGRTCITLTQESGLLKEESHPSSTWHLNTKEKSVIIWVNSSGKPAGRFTDTLPHSEGIHIPLKTAHGKTGIFSLLLPSHAVLDVNQRELLETVADHVAALVDRYNLISQAHKSSVEQESEKLYKVIFDCLSHELKTPITILGSNIHQALEQIQTEKLDLARTSILESQIALARLRRIVDNLLGMTRMEFDQGKIEPVWCDLEDTLRSAQEQISYLLEHFQLQIELPENLPMVQADPILLHHVMSNLLANATQYSPPGSTIKVFGSYNSQHIIINIQDFGQGIALEDLDGRLFQKFQRGKNAKAGGIGLGLSIVFRFMNLIGGSVNAQNNLNQSGCTFTLTFPNLDHFPEKSL